MGHEKLNVRAIAEYLGSKNDPPEGRQSVYPAKRRNPRGFRSRRNGWQALVLMRLELDI